MNTRKVLEMGGGTVIISLPKAWAKKSGVVRGSTVAVDELSPGRLMVRAIGGDAPAPKEAVVEYPRENLAYVINDVTGAYLLGYESIKIDGRQIITREDRERMKSMIRRLVGLEIMDENSKSITLQFLLESSALDPEKIVRRMASLTEGMLRDVREGIAQSDPKILSLVSERDDEVDRLYFLLVRAIRTATMDAEVAERYHLAPVETLDYRVLASYLENLGDTISELAENARVELPSRTVAKSLDSLLHKLEEMEELAIRSFLWRRRSQTRGAYLEIEGLGREALELSRNIAQMKGISTRAMIDLLGLSERIAKIFTDISDLALPTYAFTARAGQAQASVRRRPSQAMV